MNIIVNEASKYYSFIVSNTALLYREFTGKDEIGKVFEIRLQRSSKIKQVFLKDRHWQISR